MTKVTNPPHSAHFAPHVLRALLDAANFLPGAMDSPEARVMLLAIGLQESRFTHRRQIVAGKPLGPAKGYWQFERGGGCRGVVHHAASRYWMHLACQLQGVPFTAQGVWDAVESDDFLAAVAARLLLFTDPQRLPARGDVQKAWEYYLRVWRPGKPHRQTWDAFYDRALRLVEGRE
jgi:hypothetical protein